MNRIPVLLLMTFALALGVSAQSTSTESQADSANQGRTTTTVPARDDISGMYSFLKDGEFVQINQEDAGVLSGFVSRFGDDDTDKKTFLDQFFSKGSLSGNDLSFTTKTIHGTWFEFAGKVQRGPGKTPSDEGYRIIKGKLTKHKSGDGGKETAESREIEMKSFPADMDED